MNLSSVRKNLPKDIQLPGGVADLIELPDPQTGARVVTLARVDILTRLLRERGESFLKSYKAGRDFEDTFRLAYSGPNFAKTDANLIIRGKHRYRPETSPTVRQTAARAKLRAIESKLGQRYFTVLFYCIGMGESFIYVSQRLNCYRESIKSWLLKALINLSEIDVK